MPSLWFVVPAHGRLPVARVCLRQLARTCEQLERLGVRASAVVVACDDNLDVARELGFATVERDNSWLGRRFNDGFELAGLAHVDYVVPLGTDDWVDAEWVASSLPGSGTIRCSRLMAMVSEAGDRIAPLSIPYRGGHGIRVIPAGLLASCRFRPASEDRRRAIDTSTLEGLERRNPSVELAYVDHDPWQLVDWKTAGEQLNSFDACDRYRLGGDEDPFEVLAGRYPMEALEEMRGVYEGVLV